MPKLTITLYNFDKHHISLSLSTHHILNFLLHWTNTLQLGFDELGGKDDFSTEELEERLAKSQVLILDGEPSLIKSESTSNKTKRSVRQSKTANSDSDSD